MASLINKLFNRTPIPYAGRAENFFTLNKGTGSAPSASQMEQYAKVGALFAIVTALSEATSQVEWKLYKKQRDGRRRYATPDGSDGRVEVTRHPALSVWQKPNPFQTQQEFVEAIEQHIDLTGEGWMIVGRNPDFPQVGPLELWIARPDRMGVIVDDNEYLVAYYYVRPDGYKQRIEKEDVIQLKKPNPMDPYRGLGPVQSIMVDLDSARYAAQWNRNFFRNNAVPGAVIELPGHMTDAQFDEFQERWAETHRGLENAHRIGILENDAKFIESKFAHRDMQFAELRNVSTEEIRLSFRFPKPMLGSVDDVNRANAEAGEYVFAKWLIVARLERIKQALNSKYLPMFGADDLEFDYESPVPANSEADSAKLTAQVNAFTSLVTAGADHTEAALIVGLPPMKKFEKPKPPPMLAPGQKPGDEEDPDAEPDKDAEEERPPKKKEEPENHFGLALLDAFNRTAVRVAYVVDAKSDGNVCAPCGANDGRRYATREAAFRDYPNGKGYIKCVGAAYGNQCRCTVDVEEA